MKERKFTGKIFWEGELRDGTLYLNGENVSFDEAMDSSAPKGTLIPSFINSHTHIGDSFIGTEPVGSLSEIVGPNGLKHRMLNSTETGIIRKYMRESLEIMKETGTSTFMDFRESGLKGVSLLNNIGVKYPEKVVLGRPSSIEEGETMINMVDGFGMSSISDHNLDMLKELRNICRKEKKIFAIHFSEGNPENTDEIFELSPDLVVHCIFTDEDFLLSAQKRGMSISITPRSNVFYGIRADYSRFYDGGLKVMLGTDNCMVASPDMFSEMDFIYRLQRDKMRIDPREILRSVLSNPRLFLAEHGKQPDRNLIFFPNKLLTEYEIIIKGRHLRNELIR